MPLIADRLNRISPSPTMAITAKVRALKAEGKDIIGLSAGEPDFDTPAHIKQAAIEAINAGETKYTDVSGTPALRRAVAAKFKRDSGIEYAPEEIIVSTGGKQVIFNAMLATVQAGDEVIIPTPCWVSYPDIVQRLGAGGIRNAEMAGIDKGRAMHRGDPFFIQQGDHEILIGFDLLALGRGLANATMHRGEHVKRAFRCCAA